MPFIRVGTEDIYYIQQGDRGLPVIFVHGSAGSHLVWNAQVHALRNLARAIALDLPGHGKSGSTGRDRDVPPERLYNSVAQYGDLIVRFMDALALERAILVGHSLGGGIVQQVALSYPDRVAALGLVGTGARLRVLPAFLEGILTDPDKTAELVTDNSYSPAISPELRQRAVEQFRACPPTVTHADLSACNTFDIMARVGEIRAPTLIVCGTEDRMTPPKYSEYLVARLPNARLVLIPGAGHSVMVEKAEAVAQALVDFVRALPGSSAAIHTE